RAPVQQRHVPARVCPSRGGRGAARVRSLAEGLHLLDRELRHHRRHRGRTDPRAPGRPPADRVLRLHPDVRACPRRPRLAGPDPAADGWQDLIPSLHRKSVEGDWTGMANLITDEMVDTYAVTGTYDTIAARLHERYGDLLDRTAFYQPHQPGLDDPRLPRMVKEFNGR